jgi:hypothetical protein
MPELTQHGTKDDHLDTTRTDLAAMHDILLAETDVAIVHHGDTGNELDVSADRLGMDRAAVAGRMHELAAEMGSLVENSSQRSVANHIIFGAESFES